MAALSWAAGASVVVAESEALLLLLLRHRLRCSPVRHQRSTPDDHHRLVYRPGNSL